MTGRRQPTGPRAAAGPRAPAPARRTRRATGSAWASHGVTSAGREPAREPDGALAQSAAPAPDAQLSNWQLLLQQFDAFLRDPTLTLALARYRARLSDALRGLRDAIRRMARAAGQIRVRFPRRLMLALLALALPLALLALLSSSDDEDSARSAPDRQRAAAEAAAGLSLPGVGMPDLRAAPDKVPRVRVALVVDGTYNPVALRRELRSLGAWLDANHAPGTRVSVIDARTARTSEPLRATDLAGARSARERPSTTAAVRSAFARRQGRRLLVTLGSATTAPGTANSLRVATGRGADVAAAVPQRRGRRSRVTIDERRPNALAASVARAIMAISGQRERR